MILINEQREQILLIPHCTHYHNYAIDTHTM